MFSRYTVLLYIVQDDWLCMWMSFYDFSGVSMLKTFCVNKVMLKDCVLCSSWVFIYKIYLSSGTPLCRSRWIEDLKFPSHWVEICIKGIVCLSRHSVPRWPSVVWQDINIVINSVDTESKSVKGNVLMYIYAVWEKHLYNYFYYHTPPPPVFVKCLELLRKDIWK